MSSSSISVTSQTVTNDVPSSSKVIPNDTNKVEGESKKHRKPRNRKKKNPNVLNATEAGTPKKVEETKGPKKSEQSTSETTTAESSSTPNKPNKKPNNKKPVHKPNNNNNNNTSIMSRISKNRAQGKLTDNKEEQPDTTQPTQPKKRNNNNRSKKPMHLPPGNHDMSTVLTHELKNSTYECMICMDIVRPAHHTWTCDCCWAVFHLNCVQTWASKSLKGIYIKKKNYVMIN